MKTADTIIPDGPPMMRRRELLKLGLSRATVLKLESSGVLRRVFPIRNGHGYYLRDQVRSVFVEHIERK